MADIDIANPGSSRVALQTALLDLLSASGEISLIGNLTTTTLTTQNAWYPIQGSWGSDLPPSNMSVQVPAGTITSNFAGRFLTVASLSFTSGSPTNTIEFGIFKNGVLIPSHASTTWLDTTSYPNAIPISGIDDLVVGDILDLRVRCLTSPSVTLVVTDCNFSAKT